VLALIVIPFGVTTSPSAADFVCRRFHQCIKVNHQSPPSPRYARVPQAQHRMSTSSEVESGVQVLRKTAGAQRKTDAQRDIGGEPLAALRAAWAPSATGGKTRLQ